VILGSDPLRLQEIGESLRAWASAQLVWLNGHKASVVELAWCGPDAARLTPLWSVAITQLATVLEELLAAADRLREHAVEQKRASAADLPQVSAAEIPELPHGPAAVADWWRTLTPEQREHLLRTKPWMVGNADGIPLLVRDEANRRVLDAWLAGNESMRARFEAVMAPGVLLLAFDPRGDGRAAVSFGNPQTSRSVVAFVPGVGNDLTTLPSVISDARALRPDDRTAAIAWLGYDTPPSPTDLWRWHDVLSGAGETRAREGADEFRRFSAGLDIESWQRYSVVGHSYGSVVAMYAAQGGQLPQVDNLVLVGSPGARPFNSQESLDLADHQKLYTMAARGDFVAGYYGDWIPGHARGNDAVAPLGVAQALITTTRYPTDAGFGGERMSTEPWGEALLRAEGHSEYFNPGTGSLANLHRVVKGLAPGLRVGDGEDLRGVYRGVLGEVRERALGG